MERWPTWVGMMMTLGACLLGSYAVRYGLMEDARWVGRCAGEDAPWMCEVRAGLGLMIHHQALAWVAFGLALLAQVLRGGGGKGVGFVAVLLGIPAMVLYTASLAVFAIVLGALRVVRRE
ncbi:hypothetical protein G7Z99_00020 [Pseudomonas entomophila]|uniref:hypothetical protein n=1 Tax=Pseudomonas entomophila TaxID=312306 RepID=UPI0015E470D4|nr:hypothetical protein [Pseudomonas entomophila]MBA1187438.1 hypothetical protein [Pseudomonas entomophila]